MRSCTSSDSRALARLRHINDFARRFAADTSVYRSSRKLFSSLPGILLLVYANGAFSEDRPYYMWTSKDGVVNFSQSKPRDVDAARVSKPHRFGTRRGATPPPPPAPALSNVDAANAETRKLSCRSAKRTLAKLEGNRNIFIRNAEGWWREVTAETRDAETTKAREVIAKNCAGPS